MTPQKLQQRIRRMIILFLVLLMLSGITAFPVYSGLASGFLREFFVFPLVIPRYFPKKTRIRGEEASNQTRLILNEGTCMSVAVDPWLLSIYHLSHLYPLAYG
ncbi:hypothetical protein [Paraflavitalea pollutisoli]|uniref:hypothetical protein n=1 Tax=Paraflavitalea pollutisoli TaxID=3034143 RepID=UPI0023EC1EBD|nr:hypothetical protein [Paraflavitalea sp. H1-2-19X]